MRFDQGQRRQGQRHGRETGCWVYIPGESLPEGLRGPAGAVPHYRTWSAAKGSVVVRLYPGK